jgi:hypothetical protein
MVCIVLLALSSPMNGSSNSSNFEGWHAAIRLSCRVQPVQQRISGLCNACHHVMHPEGGPWHGVSVRPSGASGLLGKQCYLRPTSHAKCTIKCTDMTELSLYSN